MFFANAARAELPFVGVNPGAPIWDGSILFTDALAADIASAGCHAVRINFRIDGNPSWTASHLAKYDTIIQTAKDYDLQILGLICYEAVHGSQAEWNENYNTTGLNAYIYEFADNAYLLMNRYKDDVKRFEFWNEPNCWSVAPVPPNELEPGCFYIWPKNYANLLAETYKKCINTGGADFFTANAISMVTGGLLSHDNEGSFSTARDYFTNVFDQTAVWDAFETIAGRRYPWDYFGYHFYLNGGSAVDTSELAAYFNDIRAMKTIYSDDTKFYVTEFGWTTGGVGLQGQADNLRDSYNWLRTQSDILTAHWYQWNDGDPNGDWGLIDIFGNPKLSYYEFADQCAMTQAPVADFSAVPVSGSAPLEVQFTDLSAGDIDTWSWDFGDTASSDQPSPLHTYYGAGVFTVSLTVTGPGGTDTETKVELITVEQGIPGNFDGDDDVDGADVDRFLECVTGANVTTVPDGCETGSYVVPPPVAAWEGAYNLSGLSESIASGDLISGMTGAVEAGGFHEVTPGGTAGGLADLTDGVPGTSVEAVLLDFPGGDPPNSADPLNRALQLRYDFAPAHHLECIHVFAANGSNPGNGRVFQNYDVQYSVTGDESFSALIEDVTTGPFGRSNQLPDTDPDYLGATLTRITNPETGPLALNVDALRFIFYPVSDTQANFRDEYEPGEPGDTDGQGEAFESSIIKEIDVLEYTDLPPGGSNVADLDGDGDADLSDFGIMQRCFSGSAIPADPDCAD